MKRNYNKRYSRKLLYSLIALVPALTNAACASMPSPDHTTASGSVVCDRAYQSRSYSSIDELAQICGSVSKWPRQVAKISDLADLATWSGPDSQCEFELPPVRSVDTPVSYYTRELLPQQSFRYFAIGMTSYAEVDLDCIKSAFGERLELFKDDPIRSYAASIEKAQGGCDGYQQTVHDLAAAGRVGLGRALMSLPYYRARNQAVYLPEALYVASVVEKICGGDVSRANDLASEAIRSGYLVASSQPLAGE